MYFLLNIDILIFCYLLLGVIVISVIEYIKNSFDFNELKIVCASAQSR